MLERLGIDGDNTECEVSCWRRIPHPDTLVSGGPELDALLVGDRSVIAVEAKWRSGEGTGQGKDGTKTQLQLRSEWFAKHGEQIFGDRNMIVLGVSAFDDDLVMPLPDDSSTQMATMSWKDLTECRDHPHTDEYTRYYRWKVENSDWAVRRAAPLV